MANDTRKTWRKSWQTFGNGEQWPKSAQRKKRPGWRKWSARPWNRTGLHYLNLIINRLMLIKVIKKVLNLMVCRDKDLLGGGDITARKFNQLREERNAEAAAAAAGALPTVGPEVQLMEYFYLYSLYKPINIMTLFYKICYNVTSTFCNCRRNSQ